MIRSVPGSQNVILILPPSPTGPVSNISGDVIIDVINIAQIGWKLDEGNRTETSLRGIDRAPAGVLTIPAVLANFGKRRVAFGCSTGGGVGSALAVTGKPKDVFRRREMFRVEHDSGSLVWSA